MKMLISLLGLVLTLFAVACGETVDAKGGGVAQVTIAGRAEGSPRWSRAVIAPPRYLVVTRVAYQRSVNKSVKAARNRA